MDDREIQRLPLPSCGRLDGRQLHITRVLFRLVRALPSSTWSCRFASRRSLAFADHKQERFWSFGVEFKRLSPSKMRICLRIQSRACLEAAIVLHAHSSPTWSISTKVTEAMRVTVSSLHRVSTCRRMPYLSLCTQDKSGWRSLTGRNVVNPQRRCLL